MDPGALVIAGGADARATTWTARPSRDGRARARRAEEAGDADGQGASEEDQQQGEDGEAGHAPFRYSGRQRSRRISTCLIPSAMTMPMRPSVRSATIMSAALSVPSDWMIR